MDYISILEDILKYIDKNIKNELNVTSLAKKAGFSKYHFSRIFQWAIGYSLMEYVKLRRLSFVAYDLNSSKKIIDIAIDYGFETHSGFSKSFKKHFGCSPEQFRKRANYLLPILPSLERLKNFNIGGIIMEPKLEKRDEIKIVGFILKTSMNDEKSKKEIPLFLKECYTNGKMDQLHQKGFAKNKNEYGVCFPANEETGEFNYVIGIEVDNTEEISEEYFSCIIPAGLYAVFATPPAVDMDFAKAIQGTWQYIHAEWFPKSGYEFDENGLDYEFYDERSGKDANNVCDICIPVIKKI